MLLGIFFINNNNNNNDNNNNLVKNNFCILCFSVDVDMLADDNSERVLNLIYVSQDNVYEIPAYLLEPINLFELPYDTVRLRSIIGRGEFGKVFVGEAQGVNGNPEWTTVAIKTLTGKIH